MFLSTASMPFLRCCRLLSAVAVIALPAGTGDDARASESPNVVLIMTDDQGWGDIASHGNEYLQTPRLDQLAAEGARFERFFVSPVCAPTRASLLTGRYHLRTGTHGVTRGMENMRAEEVTVAEAFQAAGYATGCFGKWHNGRHYPYHPNGQGFEEFVGFCAGHWNNYIDTHLEHNGEPITTDGYITDVLTDFALEFIEEHKDQPFFCYVPYNAPHSPWQVPDAYWEKYGGMGLSDETRCAYAMVENIDDNVGRILDALDDHGLADNTIVLFLTDNGPNGDRYNGGMRGRKGSVHEGGVRVPLFVRWPDGIEAGGVIVPIAMHIDLFPTLVELCGIEMPETLPQDGRSLAPLLRGTASAEGEVATESKASGGRSSGTTERDWPDRTLLTFRYADGGIQQMRGAARTEQYRAVKERRGWQLFDMIDDPAQTRDIAEAQPEVLAELRGEWGRVVREIEPESLHPLPIPVGHDERPLVELPGHEAFLHPAKGEGISYHGRNGWANDWIDNWTDPQAYPYWNLDVVESGEYEVAVMYVAAEEDVGSTIRVEAGGDSVEGTVTEPHDPDPLPIHDRVGRKEAPEKVWRPLELGTIRLPSGETELRIRAVELAGDEVLDVKAVRLRRAQ